MNFFTFKTFLESVDKPATPVKADVENFKKIAKYITRGAKNPNMVWIDALQLVHWAYDEVGTTRPTDTSSDEWATYEDMIDLAVKSLYQATEQGIRDDKWRTILNSAK